MRIEPQLLRRLWPRAPESLVEAIAAQSEAVFKRYKINTRLRVVHFMVQISHESGGGTITRENMNYTSAARIATVWPKRFTVETAAPFVRNPQALADRVYGGRMGNRPGTHDGWLYRGRGLQQLTGLESYQKMAAATGLPLVEQPDLVCAPEHALRVAAAEFVALGCLPFADNDNVEGVTRRVNGGFIGLPSRKAWLARWREALDNIAIEPEPEPDAAPPPAPEPELDVPFTLPRGSDDILPPCVESPGKTMMTSKQGWAAIVATVTAVTSAAGQAVDAIRPILADPLMLTLLLVIAVGAGLFIWFDRRSKLRNDHV